MSDHNLPTDPPRGSGSVPPDHLDDGTLLSAYLSGDLDESEAAALEGRLAQDPGLAARLAQTERVLARLRRLDQVTPPDDLEERLLQRLHGARPDRTVVSLRAARERRRMRWAGIGSAAATLLLLAVLAIGGLELGIGGTDGGDETAGAAQDAEMEAMEAPAAADLVTPGAAREDAGPVFNDPGEIAERYRDLPEARALLGTDAAKAPELAAAARERLSSEPTEAACLDALPGSAVVVRAERITYQDAPAIVYVVVEASADATVLDRVVVHVLDAASCQAQARLAE